MVVADPWGIAADLIDPPDPEYAGDIHGWVRNELHEHLTMDQRLIVEAIEESRYVAVKSCHDVGKSFTAARIVGWWIDQHPPGEAFAVTTAPTDPQVKAILWREIGRVWRAGELRGRITLDARWMLDFGIGPDEMVAYGRKPADYDPAAFQGIHARYVLVILDEAGGIPKMIYDAADALATNENARVLAVGNPDDPACHFATVCKPGSGWRVIHLDGLCSPNFNAEGVRPYPRVQALMAAERIKPSTEKVPDRLRDLLLSPQWVDERIQRWGTDSPLFVAKVRGQFPDVSEDSLIEPGWVVKAGIREAPADVMDAAYGVDVARFGRDKTQVYLREGCHVRHVLELAKKATTVTAGEVKRLVDGHVSRPIAQVDDVGIGGAVTDMLAEDNYEVAAMIGGSSAEDAGCPLLRNGKAICYNSRSWWYWQVRQAFSGPSGTGDDGDPDIDPADEELAAQLTNIKYAINRWGQIVVEPKEDMMKRGVASPDRADAFVYAWVHGAAVMPAAMTSGSRTVMGNILDENW